MNEDSHAFALGLVKCGHEGFFPPGEAGLEKVWRAEKVGRWILLERGPAPFGKALYSFEQDAVGWIGEVDFPYFRRKRGLQNLHCARASSCRRLDIMHTVPRRFEFGRVRLHRGPVQNEFLDMHLQRPVGIAAEIERVFDEPDVAAAADCRVLGKELVRENEGDFHMNLERKPSRPALRGAAAEAPAAGCHEGGPANGGGSGRRWPWCWRAIRWYGRCRRPRGFERRWFWQRLDRPCWRPSGRCLGW